MKYRNSFVANSSSSSFVIRGIEITINELKKALQLPDEATFDWIVIPEKFGLTIESTTNVFHYDKHELNNSNIIIGFQGHDLEDGEPVKISFSMGDEEIKSQLKSLLNREIDALDTFVQFVSNDNF